MITLSTKRDFQNLFKSRQDMRLGTWAVLKCVNNNNKFHRWAFIIPKHVGNAVIRNRLRRWCKEAVRRHVHNIPLPSKDMGLLFKKRSKEFYRQLRFCDVEVAISSLTKEFSI